MNHQEIERAVARIMRTERRHRDMSQDVLAAKMTEKGCNWSRTTVAKIEAGTRQMTVTEFSAICDCLTLCGGPARFVGLGGRGS